MLLDKLHVHRRTGGIPQAQRWNLRLVVAHVPQLTTVKKNMHVQPKAGRACFLGCLLTPWMFTLSFSFFLSLFSLPPFLLLGSCVSCFPWIRHYCSCQFFKKPTFWNSPTLLSPVFPSCTHTWTDPLNGFIAHLPEWKLQQQVLTVIHRGLGLTLSHRAPVIINSSCIVRGICMAIFTSHNYCQSGDCNQGLNRERERWRAIPQR